MSEDVLLTVDGTVATITFNRPENMNTITAGLLLGLEQAALEIAGREDVNVAVLTGAGNRAFCAGMDVKAFSAGEMERAGRFGRGELGMLTRLRAIFITLENLPMPLIAAINGHCHGGGVEFILTCDMRLASDKARFSLPEVKLGVMPDMGSTQRLPRLIGLGKARELFYTGRVIDAAEAERIGLVEHVYPADQLLDEAYKLAREIAANPPLAVQGTKRATGASTGTPLDSGLRFETEVAAAVIRRDLIAERAKQLTEKKG